MNFKKLDEDLDKAVVLLIKAVDKIPRKHRGKIIDNTHILLESGVIVPITYNQHRVIYDTFNYAVGDTLIKLIIEIWKKLRTDNYESGLEYMTSRTLIELGVYKSTSYFSIISVRHKQLLTDATILEVCSHFLSSAEDGAVAAKKLLEEEKDKISPKVYEFIQSQIENQNRYGKKGVFSRLTTKSQQKIEAIYKNFEDEVQRDPTLNTIQLEGVFVIGSGALHANIIPLGTMLNNKQAKKMQYMLFTLLLRIALYNASLIARFIKDEALINEVEEEIKKIDWSKLKPSS